ncbi:MAG TPA: response regulator [Nitrososphaeraceae archaeon]|nr:response regulator [Nitrososphaeraceae archaeon]
MSHESDNESGSQIIRDLAIRKRGHIDSCESQAMDAIKKSNEEISFSGKSMDYCVSIVDIVNSTRIVSEIVDADQVRKYYTIFQNTVSNIIEKHGAKTFKTLGDSLIYYFPMTEDSTNKIAFQRVMECSMDVLEACSPMNVELQREQLPSIGYRLSADYGRLEVARCSTSESDDLFGSTINICSKINRKATTNGMVIGGDLYTVLRSLGFTENFRMHAIGEYAGGSSRYSYPIYSVTPRKTRSILGLKGMPSEDLFTRNGKVTEQIPNYLRYGGSVKSDRNIMLVDDEPDVLFTYKCFLSSRGYNVVTFTNPREALIHFVQSDPSYYGLVILDIRMPHLNGLQLFHKFREIDHKIKIIFVSALDGAAELVSLLPDLNEENIMQKPVNQTTFLEKVEQILS